MRDHSFKLCVKRTVIKIFVNLISTLIIYNFRFLSTNSIENHIKMYARLYFFQERVFLLRAISYFLSRFPECQAGSPRLCFVFSRAHVARCHTLFLRPSRQFGEDRSRVPSQFASSNEQTSVVCVCVCVPYLAD